jgi:hypothetical protein
MCLLTIAGLRSETANSSCRRQTVAVCNGNIPVRERKVAMKDVNVTVRERKIEVGNRNEDFNNILIPDLQNRGYGWLRLEGVQQELEKIKKEEKI